MEPIDKHDLHALASDLRFDAAAAIRENKRELTVFGHELQVEFTAVRAEIASIHDRMELVVSAQETRHARAQTTLVIGAVILIPLLTKLLDLFTHRMGF